MQLLGPTKANFVYGPLHRFFGLYFLLSFALALYTLWKTTRAASGLRKLQLRYLLLGILLGGSGAITTNLLIPLFAGTSRYSALGPYFSLLVVSFSAHAIIRYRLMDIRVVFRQGVVYVCAIVAGASVFIALRRITEARDRLRQRQHSPSSSSLGCHHPCDLLPTPQSLASALPQSLRVPRNIRLPANHSRC